MESVTFNRRELYDLIWSESILSLSKKYAISDVGLRKACMRMNIPFPPSGYWSKIQHGQHPPVASFPEQRGAQNELTLHLRDADHPATIDGLTPQAAMQQRIETEYAKELVVYKELTDPDPLIISAQKALLKKNKFYKPGDLLRTEGNELNIRVTEDHVNRALCLMDAVVKVLRKRGYEFVFRHNSSYIAIEDEQIEITLKETTTVVENTENYMPRSYNPNGKFELKFDDIVRITTGRDGKTPIEDQLSKIFARLELMLEEMLILTKEWKIRQAQNAEKERLRKAYAERKKLEFESFKKVFQDAADWRDASNLRRYINAVENNAKDAGDLNEETQAWITWARNKADWYDPLTETEDHWLDENDRKKLQGTEQPQQSGSSYFDHQEEKPVKTGWPLLPWYLKK